MGAKTGIAWTDRTWNPWQGCAKVSAGCDRCYMFREKRRYGQDPEVVVRSSPATFRAPLRWEREGQARVFACSWSDFFIPAADPWREEAWDIIRATPQLTYQILTKRPLRIRKCLPSGWGAGWPNVWLGVSVEDQATADARLPVLAEIPARLRFVSVEPMLDQIDLDLVGIGWAIFGGESGPDARMCSPGWIRDGLYQCHEYGVPAFVKQLGSRYAKDNRFHQAHGADPAEWHPDLRVQEFPRVT